MSVGFPANTVILILSVATATAVGVWLIVSQTLNGLSTGKALAASVKRRWRWGVGAVLIGGLLFRVALAVNPPGGGVLNVVLNFSTLVVILALGLLALIFSPVFRQIVRSIPQTWLVGIHALRIGGFLFLALLDMKLLPAEFALPAGCGDVIVGALSLFVVYAIARHKPYARSLTIAWNLLGLLDFVTALTTGAIFIAPFATQMVVSGVVPLYLNYVFIVPGFAVPIFALLHLFSLMRVLSAGQNAEPRDLPTEQRAVRASN